MLNASSAAAEFFEPGFCVLIFYPIHQINSRPIVSIENVVLRAALLSAGTRSLVIGHGFSARRATYMQAASRNTHEIRLENAGKVSCTTTQHKQSKALNTERHLLRIDRGSWCRRREVFARSAADVSWFRLCHSGRFNYRWRAIFFAYR